VKDFKYNQPARNTPLFITKFEVDVPNFAKTVNGKLIVPLNNSSMSRQYVDTDELMKYFSIPRGLTIIDEIDITIPDNYWIGTLPKPEKINSTYGSFEFSIETNSSSIIIKKKIILKKGDYINEAYNGFKIFFDQIEKIERRQLVLNSKT